MKIGSIGYSHSHDKTFVMDRPHGTGAWLFLIIKTPALFEINGVMQNVRENSFVVLSPQTPCRYTALDDRYTDDWLYLSAEEDNAGFFSRLEIPINKPVYLGNVQELSQIMHILTYEHYSAENYHEEIEGRYLEIMFMKIARIIKNGKYQASRPFLEKNASLTHIRTRIFTQPETVESVERLAEETGMSLSGFQHSYKKLFGVSVKNDIVSGRLERSKRLLTATSLTLDKIAEQCGYASALTFIRQFKARFRKTPTEYRKGD